MDLPASLKILCHLWVCFTARVKVLPDDRLKSVKLRFAEEILLLHRLAKKKYCKGEKTNEKD